MKTIGRTAALASAVALGLVLAAASASAQKAIVYCPASDQAGCDNIVAALQQLVGPTP